MISIFYCICDFSDSLNNTRPPNCGKVPAISNEMEQKCFAKGSENVICVIRYWIFSPKTFSLHLIGNCWNSAQLVSGTQEKMSPYNKWEDPPLPLSPVIRLVLLHTEQIVQRHFSSTVCIYGIYFNIKVPLYFMEYYIRSFGPQNCLPLTSLFWPRFFFI